jgi:hypothetical protein
LATTSQAAKIIYNVDQTVNTGGEGGVTGNVIKITGSFTIADLGVVTLSDITDYSLSFTSSTYADPTILTPSNSLVELEGTLLEATATELAFDVTAGLKGDFRVRGTTEDVNDFVRFSITNDSGEGSQFFAEHTPNFSSPFTAPRDSGSFNPGSSGTYTLAVIPEPSVLGLGGLALLLRRRVR